MEIFFSIDVSAGFGTRVPEFIYVIFIMSLPTITENFGVLQEMNDRVASQFKPEYIFNIEEEFDYIVGELRDVWTFSIT